MTVSSILTPKACLERAIAFKADAEQLRGISNQWFAVSYFYAAYHTVRASLMDDKIFADLPRLKAHNPNWIPDDRWNGHHSARVGPNPPGVSDLVKALYPDIAIDYGQLHSASIAVRYGLGLDGYDGDSLASAFHKIATAATAGELVAA